VSHLLLITYYLLLITYRWHIFIYKRSMRTAAIIRSGLAGTTAMTAFSYILSAINRNDFREPALLGKLIFRLNSAVDKLPAKIAGWHLHYSVGFIFCSVYDRIWEKSALKPGIRSGFLLGGICGIIAMIVWKTTLSLHPRPPKIYFLKFYAQLFPAHLIFGMVAGLAYQRSNRENDSSKSAPGQSVN
jgi:hypothetical protein